VVDDGQAFERPYVGFVEAMQRSVADDAGQAELEEAFGRYADELRDATETEPARRATEAFMSYERAVRGVVAPERVAELFRAYVAEVQRAWAATDVDRLSPEAVGAVAQQLGSAAWVAFRQGEGTYSE
jgi:hypothetical protein